MTIPEMIGTYSMQLKLTNSLAKSTTRTIAGIINQKAVNYIAATEEDYAAVTRFDDYARALANLTNRTMTADNLIATFDTDEILSQIGG